MASKWPPVKNAGYTFRCVLFAQSDNQIIANPTIAAGDWKVSTDGAAFANLGTLPDVDPDTTAQVLVTLSAGEMNGDEIMVTAIDASGDEWHSAAWVLHTVAQTLDTIDTNVDSILADTGTDGVVLANDAITAAKIAADAIDASALAADAVTEIQSGLATAANLATLTGYVDTEVASILAAVDTEVAAIKAKTDNLPAAPAAVGSAMTLASGAITAAVVATGAIDADAIAADAVTEIQSGLATAASIAALNNLSAAQVNAEVVDVLRTDTLPDSYAADGAQPTIAQALLMVWQYLSERAVSGTTVTVKKPDGTTSAMTFTLDDAVNPASITRSS